MTKDKLEKWYRLDASADLYPMSLSRITQSNYRVAVNIKDLVDPEILLDALKLAYKRFPSFKVHLRKGLFRYYFEENNSKPEIFTESGIYMENVDFRKNHKFVIRVSYYENRINWDFFHGLTDGTGALEFIKTHLYAYYLLLGKEGLDEEYIKFPGEEVFREEIEDGTQKYFKDFPLNDKAIGSMTGSNTAYIKDKFLKKAGFGIIQGSMNALTIRDLSKKYGCSITELLAAIALLSIKNTYVSPKERKNLAIMIPVNLRSIFPSKTMHNFTTLVRCELDHNTVEPTIEAYIAVIKEELRKGLADTNQLNKKLSIAALMAKKWYLRIMPSFIKMIFIKVPKTRIVRPRQTLILSNLGIVKTPCDISDEIGRLSINVNVSNKTPVSIGVSTHNGEMVIMFTSKIVNTKFQREFFTMLAKEGVDISIISNNREISDASERNPRKNAKLSAKHIRDTAREEFRK